MLKYSDLVKIERITEDVLLHLDEKLIKLTEHTEKQLV